MLHDAWAHIPNSAVTLVFLLLPMVIMLSCLIACACINGARCIHTHTHRTLVACCSVYMTFSLHVTQTIEQHTMNACCTRLWHIAAKFCSSQLSSCPCMPLASAYQVMDCNACGGRANFRARSHGQPFQCCVSHCMRALMSTAHRYKSIRARIHVCRACMHDRIRQHRSNNRVPA